MATWILSKGPQGSHALLAGTYIPMTLADGKVKCRELGVEGYLKMEENIISKLWRIASMC